VALFNIFREVLDDDRIVTGTVDDLIAFVIALTNPEDHMLGKYNIDD
jgi:hypothetical protein